jgi:hypothetical protein
MEFTLETRLSSIGDDLSRYPLGMAELLGRRLYDGFREVPLLR